MSFAAWMNDANSSVIYADLSAIKDLSVKPVDSVLCVLRVSVFDKSDAPWQACHVVHRNVHIPAQISGTWRVCSSKSAMF